MAVYCYRGMGWAGNVSTALITNRYRLLYGFLGCSGIISQLTAISDHSEKPEIEQVCAFLENISLLSGRNRGMFSAHTGNQDVKGGTLTQKRPFSTYSLPRPHLFHTFTHKHTIKVTPLSHYFTFLRTEVFFSKKIISYYYSCQFNTIIAVTN